MTLHKSVKMQITHKKHFWPFFWLVFAINHICSNNFVFTIRKNNCDDCGYKKSLFTKKDAYFLISALGVTKKGVGVIYQL